MYNLQKRVDSRKSFYIIVGSQLPAESAGGFSDWSRM
jgi:hypothetical protein